MSQQAEKAVLLLTEAIDKMCSDLPTEVDEEVAGKIETVVQRIKENREKRKTQKIPEGKYFADPLSKSTYLKDLRELLLIFKRVIIPIRVSEELAKLRAIAAMVGEAAQVDQNELAERLRQAELADREQVEVLQEMATIVANLAKNG